MLWSIMSTLISAVQATLAVLLDISLLSAVQVLLGAVFGAALLVLFKPLLLGVARAMVLVLKPRMSKEQRLARRQMRDAVALNKLLNSMDSAAPSHAAELRALSARS